MGLKTYQSSLNPVLNIFAGMIVHGQWLWYDSEYMFVLVQN